MEEWDSLRDNWPELKCSVGCIDRTSHRINRSIEYHGLCYSGHRHMHCRHTQVIIDNCKIYQVWFSWSYQWRNNISSVWPYWTSRGTYISTELFSFRGYDISITASISDTIYKCTVRRQDNDTRRKSVEVNDKIRKKRVYVEHSIRRIKI